MQSLTPIDFAPPPVSALKDESRISLKAARLWVMLARNHRNPRPVINALMGTGGPCFSLLMDRAVTAWPDPFATFPPCAATISPDEHSLLSILSHAEAGTRPAFDEAFADLLPPSDRDRLWDAAERLVADRIGAG